jgi:hypothetical protein
MSSSELESCGLAGIGLIGLALNPASVEEQPVASTTTTASITAVDATRRRWLKKAPERSLLNNLGAGGWFTSVRISSRKPRRKLFRSRATGRYSLSAFYRAFRVLRGGVSGGLKSNLGRMIT